jgi:hypothetical protein
LLLFKQSTVFICWTTSVLIEFDDVSRELERCSEKLINDPEQSKLIKTTTYLQKKHHEYCWRAYCNSISALKILFLS